MKDLDFDELDRAVNSLITSQSKTPSDDSGSNISLTQTVNTLPTLPVIPVRPAIERPSTGRFMDVVHPSSDMRTTLVTPERTPAQQITATPVAEQPVALQASTINTDDKDDDSDIDQISNDIANTLDQNANNALESPFLAGAKVEKRPLNAFSSETTASLDNDQISTQVPTTVNSEEKTSETATPLPPELQNDLLSIESRETMISEEAALGLDVIAKPENKTEIKPELEPVLPSESPKEDFTPVSEPSDEKASVVELASEPKQPTPALSPVSTPNPVVATSINPQYVEQPSTGVKDSGAIYDTNSYHKAMPAPVKQKSGWMWIIWIIALMAVSVGAGVAVYFFVLPRL